MNHWGVQLASNQRRVLRSRKGATRTSNKSDVKVVWSLWLKRAALLMALSAVSFSLMTAVDKLQSVPVGELVLTGYTGGNSAVGASKNELLALVDTQLDEGFWQLDLLQLKANIESHPWVRQAVIRRQWPNQLVIGIDEYVAVARWNEHYLLSATGDVFLPSEIAAFSHLPRLKVASLRADQQQRPSREIIKEAVTWFNQFQKPLTHYGLSVVEQAQLDDGDFLLLLSNGLTLVLGADQLTSRFDRFLTLLDGALIEKLDDIEVIDLRYVNGLSVLWHSHIDSEGSRALAQVEVTSSLLR
ncbi:MAG: FtsQ-type POTRA domain-containing protein [Cellvibrionales bacterium]|jgi:cell division septal protein FtsQ|nr:FtsQ-type POTRA domain-containing protein [Cellvibrionales bacterium]